MNRTHHPGNKGSISIIKYLFLGSVAKDLYDETLDAQFEPLEEIVILVKRSSVSVLWRYGPSINLSLTFSMPIPTSSSPSATK